jgi:cobalt-precorrin-5B (C1)-methyltransferase
MTKLGQGLLDLHSRRGEVDLQWLGRIAVEIGGDDELADRIGQSNSAMEAFSHADAAGVDLPRGVAEAAWRTAARALGGGMRLEVVVFDRSGGLLARTGLHDAGP